MLRICCREDRQHCQQLHHYVDCLERQNLFRSNRFCDLLPEAVLGSPRGSIASLPGFPSAGCTVFPYVANPPYVMDTLFPSNAVNDIDDRRLNAGTFLRVYGQPSPGATEFAGRAVRVSPSLKVNTYYALEVWWFTIPDSSLSWRNQEDFTTVARSKDAVITWSGADSRPVAITGNSTNEHGIGARFFCFDPSATGSITVPGWVLSALPASSPVSFPGLGYWESLGLAELPTGPARKLFPFWITAGHFLF